MGFGKEQYTGYNTVELDKVEEQERGGVQAFASGVEPFGGGHKHKHHHHKHSHKHKEEHEHEEEQKHEHSHEHAHKGGSWRRSSTDVEDSDFLVGKILSKPGTPLEATVPGGEPNVSWEQERPAAYPDEYQEIEYDWDL